MKKLKIILASSSKYRKELLKKLNLKFKAISPKIDESPLINETAIQTSLRLSLLKAKEVAKNNKNALIIGSDQVLLFNNKQYGKPLNIKKSKQMLLEFCNKNLTYYSSISLLNSQTNKIYSYTEITKVKLKNYNESTIDKYIAKEPDALNCAGGIKSEGLGMILIEKIQSNDPNAIMGIPMFKLIQFLEKEKIIFI